MRHLTRGFLDKTWCGTIPVVPPAIRVLDVECVPCLDAVIEAAVQARRRKVQLARDADR